MSAAPAPRPELLVLAAEIDEHLRRVELEVDGVCAAVPPGSVPDTLRLRAAASHLHAFYTGVDVILSRLAERFGGLPSGSDWHARLLRLSGVEVPNVRPAALRPDTVDRLDRYRAFRHFIRNAYGVTLEWERMREKVDLCAGAFAALKADLSDFRAFLLRASGLAI